MIKRWQDAREERSFVEAVRSDCVDDALDGFKLFCQYVFKFVYRKKFIWAEHHDEIARALIRVYVGLDKNLIINIPPRYSKTEMVCLFVAWAFGMNPLCEFMHLSYSDDLAKRNSAKIKEIIKSQFYHDIFGIEIDQKNDSKGEWRTEDGGIFYATATGGQLTGFGAGSSTETNKDGEFVFHGMILIDDPLKPDDAHTIRRDQANRRWDETIKSRRNSPDSTPTVCIMQRIHEGDFTSELLSDTDEHFRLLKMPALRSDGSALWPLKHNRQKLEAMKEKNVYTFSAQYQQDPSPAGGSVFKEEWWKYYIEIPAFIKVIITGDTAQKTKERNDFSVFQAWGEFEGCIYLIDQVRGKWESPDLKRIAVAFIRKIKAQHKLHSVHIEDKASGTGLIQSLPAETGAAIIGIPRNIDKATRSYDAAPYVQSGQVLLPKHGSFTQPFVMECSSFTPEMTHLHDDQVDPMMDAIDILLDKKPAEFWIETA